MLNDDRRRLLSCLLGTGILTSPARTLTAATAAGAAAPVAGCPSLLGHAPRPLAGGAPEPLCERFPGRVLLIVNTASRCGFTPQFEALETLWQRYRERGLVVLGFPSDDFRQELEQEADIAAFCRLNYGVSFPMFGKVSVRGEGAHPLYRELAAATDGYPRWNFNKYLIDRDGRVVARYDADVAPLEAALVGAVEALL